MSKNRLFACLLLLMIAPPAASAALQPAAVFTDHTVLQRDKPVPVWGWAEPGEKIRVSFAGQSKSCTADDAGKWMVILDPLKTNATGQTMKIAGRETVELKDILVGDVWICSGQSNMGRNVDRSIIPDDMKWEHPTIRYFGVGKSEKYPIERFNFDPLAAPKWKVCADEESTRGCCAVGFFFAERVQREVDVPIGILWQAWAGSIIQEWLPREAWRMEPELEEMADRVDVFYPNTPHGRKVWKQRLAEMEAWLGEAERSLEGNGPFPHPQPLMPEPTERGMCGFYNGKIHPLKPFAIKGVLWYQGESDMRNSLWDVELKAMARAWRDLFDTAGKGEDIPFYWMQIQRSGDYCSPLVRQKQFNALRLVPNSGMAVLLDLDVNVHPVNKVDSGIRLAHLALHRDYGKKDLAPSGPVYKSHSVKGDTVTVEFEHTYGGLKIGSKDLLDPPVFVDSKKVPNVELAGADGKWHPGVAEIQGNRMVVRSQDVPKPVHVRYCYSNIPDPPFLYNSAGLPAAMFSSVD